MIQIFLGVIVALCASGLQAAQVKPQEKPQTRASRAASVELSQLWAKKAIQTTQRTRSASDSEILSLTTPTLMIEFLGEPQEPGRTFELNKSKTTSVKAAQPYVKKTEAKAIQNPQRTRSKSFDKLCQEMTEPQSVTATFTLMSALLRKIQTYNRLVGRPWCSIL